MWTARAIITASAVMLSLSAFGGCATVRPVQGDPRDLTVDEIALIHSVSKRTPMKLVTNDTPAGAAQLSRKSADVNPGDPEIGDLIARMYATVTAENGVGIAAPQVGIMRRVILVKRLDRTPEKPFVAYLNPVLKKMDGEKVVDWEGCLSVPEGFGRVSRAVMVTVEYDTADGLRASELVEGFTARIFQHEIDHLDGVLFIDRMEPGKLMPKEKYKEMRRQQKSVACLLP